MSQDDPADGAIHQGEPPYRSRRGPETASSVTASPAAINPITIILVWSLRVVAALIAGWAGLGAFFAMIFRFDSLEEFEMVKRFDVEAGGALALAVVLFFVPNRIKKPVQSLASLPWSGFS